VRYNKPINIELKVDKYMAKNRLTKTQLWLLFIPFFGAIGFQLLITLSDIKRYYTTCVVPQLASIGVVFSTGIVFAIIGLFSYIITLIISIILLGIIWN